MQNQDLLSRRRDRSIAIILRLKESECDPYLPADIAARLRKVILDQLNELTDLAADLIRSGEMNELYLKKFDELYAAVVGPNG